jgi:dTDP-4-amino-4,6-dideoxygalactose transaminase
MSKEVEQSIPFIDFVTQFEQERDEIFACVKDIFTRGEFVGLQWFEAFEKEIAEFNGVAHPVARQF